MPNFEKPKEKLVEDTGAARAAAEAENPARSYLIKNREKLSLEQQKALEWLATSEGEGAVADFEKAKESQKNIVRERALELLKIDPEVQLAEKITIFPKQTTFESKAYKEEKERILKELNDELVPLLFKERIDLILSAKEDLAGKLKEVDRVKRAFGDGIFQIIQNKEVPELLSSFDEENRESYFYGLLAPCLVRKVWAKAADVLSFADRKFGVDYDELVKKIGDKLSEGHSDEKFNKEMESHNYIFNPEKNRYEKAE